MMWRPRRQSPSSSSDGGWAAFDLKHRQKQGLVPPPNDNNDPFPPLMSPAAPTVPSRPPCRPFSSLLVLRDSSPPPASSSVTNNSNNAAAAAANTALPVTVAHDNHYHRLRGNVDGFTAAHHVSERHPTDDDGIDSKHRPMHVIGGCSFNSVPIEPEWEDDDHDVYLTHRKHALRTMRYVFLQRPYYYFTYLGLFPCLVVVMLLCSVAALRITLNSYGSLIYFSLVFYYYNAEEGVGWLLEASLKPFFLKASGLVEVFD